MIMARDVTVMGSALEKTACTIHNAHTHTHVQRNVGKYLKANVKFTCT